jgi:hypothetical protein
MNIIEPMCIIDFLFFTAAFWFGAWRGFAEGWKRGLAQGQREGAEQEKARQKRTHAFILKNDTDPLAGM